MQYHPQSVQEPVAAEGTPVEEVTTDAAPTEDLPVQETGAADELPTEETETVGGER